MSTISRLIHGTPKVLYLALDLYGDLVDEERVAVASVCLQCAKTGPREAMAL
ncbi:MAG: hypothetical protein ACI8PT_002270, partial [Gammaproteobacteria bacterium]